MALSHSFLRKLSKVFESINGRPMEVPDLEDYLVSIGWPESDARREGQQWVYYPEEPAIL